MADKFLEPADLQEIVEAISMTIDLLDERVIAERIGLPLETVRKIKQESQIKDEES